MTLLKQGHQYSRREISQMLGGSNRSYLPTKNGVVLCGGSRLENRWSPKAPEEVDFGPGINTRRAVDIIARHKQTIPVFIRRGAASWEYVGKYRCTGLRDDIETCHARMVENPDRGEIVGSSTSNK